MAMAMAMEARNKNATGGQVPEKNSGPAQENSISSVFSKRLRALRKKVSEGREREKVTTRLGVGQDGQRCGDLAN